jgi:hypothetical protein
LQKKWARIDKSHSLKPQQGTYQDWKPHLAEEGNGRCVYCAILDVELGGQRNFHVEHYKPKSRPEFAHLINDYENLFYACALCNTFKSDSWFQANDGDWSVIHYPNPSLYNYGDFFEISDDVFTLTGNHLVGTFLIQRLHLNRFQLIHFRRYEHSLDKSDEILESTDQTREELKPFIKDSNDTAFKYYEKLTSLREEILLLLKEKLKRSLYVPDELR